MKILEKLKHKINLVNPSIDTEPVNLDDVLNKTGIINNIVLKMSDITYITIDKFVTEGIHVERSDIPRLELIKSYSSFTYLKNIYGDLIIDEELCVRANRIESLEDIKKGIENTGYISKDEAVNKCNISLNKVRGHMFKLKDLYVNNVCVEFCEFHTLHLINLTLDTVNIKNCKFHSLLIENCHIKNLKVELTDYHSTQMCLDSTIINHLAFASKNYHDRRTRGSGNFYDYSYNVKTGKLERGMIKFWGG